MRRVQNFRPSLFSVMIIAPCREKSLFSTATQSAVSETPNSGMAPSPTPGDTAWAMPEENVEIVKSFLAAFADRDQAAAATFLHPEVEIRPAIVGGPEGVVYRGLDGNRRFWHDIHEAWKEFRIEPEEFRDLGEQVLVLGRAFALAGGSGIALDQSAAWLAVVRDGQII